MVVVSNLKPEKDVLKFQDPKKNEMQGHDGL